MIPALALALIVLPLLYFAHSLYTSGDLGDFLREVVLPLALLALPVTGLLILTVWWWSS